MKLLFALLLAPVIGALAAFPSAWGLMLAIGIVHAQVLPLVIPAGYWAVWPLAWVITTIGIGIASGTDS